MSNLSLNRTVAWFNKTEGRDKICKSVQYGSRFVMWYLAQKGKKDLSVQFQSLFKGMQQSRKLFRLAKTLNELQKLIEIMNKKDMNDFDRVFQSLQRLSFGLYWIFDNITILCAIQFFKKDPKPSNKLGMLFWFLALIFGLIIALRDLIVIQKQKEKLRKSNYLQSDQPTQTNDQQKRAEIHKKEIDLFLTFLKIFGDLIPSSQGSEIFPKLTGRNWNDGIMGLGGFISGSIAAYQAY